MRKSLLALAVAGTLGACSTAQITAAQTDISTGIAAACKDVLASAAVANAAAPTNQNVVAITGYATAACTIAGPVASLVQNSGTLQWLGTLQGQLNATKPASVPNPVPPAA
jgi:hypothetical protein